MASTFQGIVIAVAYNRLAYYEEKSKTTIKPLEDCYLPFYQESLKTNPPNSIYAWHSCWNPLRKYLKIQKKKCSLNIGHETVGKNLYKLEISQSPFTVVCYLKEWTTIP